MHPIFLYITDNFYIGTYGVFVALGVFIGVFTVLHRAKKVNIAPDFVYDIAFYMVLSGIIGSRLLFIIVNFKTFLADPIGMIISRQGFVFLGGFIAALFVGLYMIRKYKYPVLGVADVIIPSVPLAHLFGRLGCFSAGCCYGKKCSAGWEFLGAKFPAVYDKKGELIGSFAYIDHLQNGWVEQSDKLSLLVYPTQLFESFGNLIIFGILVFLYKKRKFDGQITGSYLILYSCLRFSIEFFRGDVDRGIWLNLISTSQILTLCAGAAGVIMILKQRKKAATLTFETVKPVEKKKNDKKARKK